MAQVQSIDHIQILTQLGLFGKTGKINSNILRKESDQLTNIKSYVAQYTQFLPDDTLFSERVYCLKHNISVRPVCSECNTPVPFNLNYYAKYCSVYCSVNSTSTKQKVIATNLRKFGTPTALSADCVRAKIEQTNIERHGVSTVLSCKEIRNKIKQTNIERYGVEWSVSADKIKDKIKQTNNSKLGVDYPLQSVAILDKIKQIHISTLGVDNPFKSDVVMNKIQKANILKYGTAYAQQQHMISTGALTTLQSPNCLLHKHHIEKKGIVEIANELSVAVSTVINYLNMHNIPLMKYGGSFAQKQIQEYITSIYSGEILCNYKLINHTEVDIYIPELSIGFEYNGLYWHSEMVGRDKKYHINKTTTCNSQNIELIQIFENEWVTNPEIVKSRIKSLLKLNDTIGARKCTIVLINTVDERDFFDNNHIQGYVNSRVCYGLLYESRIVAAMSFGNPRYNLNYDYELLRYASSKNINVVGGASKLLTHFIAQQKPSSIISYADMRWSAGTLYERLNFNYLGTSTPNYFYFKNGRSELYSRIKFQKHKLKDKLDVFDPELTEWENMKLNGYNRIWDCGNSKWELIL